MGILVKVKYTDIGFSCSEYRNWRDIVDNCPIVEKVFHGTSKEDDKPANYSVNYKDARLKELQSDVDKFRNSLSFLDVIYFLAEKISKTVHQSMSKKKDLEVQCLWK
ncbi:MAG: hypothetical protein KKF67_01080 [Nanoarchaeota archaeon]|nr:hypothetical protein [Nanoarchaeota archaeon]